MLRFQFKQLLVCLLPLLLPSKLLAAIEGDVYSMDLEQLMSIEVVSASKKSQTLLKTAAAAYIITEEDIRRSGATSLPEVLRGVPGVQVAQIDANKWAVSMRGFNDRFASKLLVMIDGRSIYNPLFSGVYWNMHDMLLEDIDRIEVIRGPGGSLWGANAVNGVINIITKKADETQGTQITFLGGSLEKNISARYGARINDQTSFRVYAKGRHNERFSQQSQLQSLGPANDQWRNFTTGFRVDGEIDGNTDWMLQGGYNVGTADQFAASASLTPPSNLMLRDTINYNTGNMLFLWNKQLSLDNKWRVQVYYDYFNRTALSTTHNIHTVDIEIQNQRRFFDRHNVVWGFGYRSILDELEPGFEVSFSPEKLHFKTFNTFFQNEVQLTEKLRFTVGSKFEHNDFTGFEYQPSARVLFEVNERNSVWAAFSRAVRIPSRASRDIRINVAASSGPPPTLISILGDRRYRSENVNAFEVGYRSLLTSNFSLDTALFFNLYDDLSSSERNAPVFELQPLPPHLLIANTFDNRTKANTYGAEIMGKWQVTDVWQLMSSYTLFKMDARNVKNSTSSLNRLFVQQNSDPRHQFSVRSTIQLPYNLEFNTSFYYTDKLQGQGVSEQARLDLRLAWNPQPKLELAVVGQNLTNKDHFEFNGTDTFHSNIPRSAYGRITMRY